MMMIDDDVIVFSNYTTVTTLFELLVELKHIKSDEISEYFKPIIVISNRRIYKH